MEEKPPPPEAEFVIVVGANGVEHIFPKPTEEMRQRVVRVLGRLLAQEFLKEMREGRL